MDQGLFLAAILGLVIASPVVLVVFLLARRSRREATLAEDGIQELEIAVLGGFNPRVAVVREGIPVRLKFTRLETEECSSRVIFSGLKINRHLPPYRTTILEFLPPSPGEYLFTSDMGVYQGRLVVQGAGSPAWLPRPFSRPQRGEPPTT